MTKFILVRHGQSDANANGYLVGIKEAPLSPKGEKQAKAVSEYFKNIQDRCNLFKPLRARL